MGGEVRVQLVEEGADAERLDELTRYLRGELLELDVEDVSVPQVGEAPAGTRSGGIVAVGELLVTFAGATQALAAVVAAVRSWLARGREPARTVRLEMDGETLELSGASAADQERLVALFLSRHSAPADQG